jgi:hypothetical protein
VTRPAGEFQFLRSYGAAPIGPDGCIARLFVAIGERSYGDARITQIRHVCAESVNPYTLHHVKYYNPLLKLTKYIDPPC